jgi:hypothetical protein
MFICGEQPRHATPAPGAVPRAVNENDRTTHAELLIGRIIGAFLSDVDGLP